MATTAPKPNPDRRITIQWAVSYFKSNETDGIRLYIQAVDANLMTDKIFQYLRRPLNPNTGQEVDTFDHVSSPPDIEEVPEDAPIATEQPAWFRINYVDLYLRSQHEADDVLESILEDVRVLKRTYDIMDVTNPAGSETVGVPEETSSSSSSSSQSSESAPSESSSSSSSG